MKTLGEEGWKKKLTKEQYHILREKGTEPPGRGHLLHNKETGMYTCAGCGAELFSSEKKFESGTGWPSFWDCTGNVGKRDDRSAGMVRTEVFCKKCGGHLGHVFSDAPQTPTGLRYCINSAAMGFKRTKSKPQ
jgi:peptide-methionine (R)-S-oxide reductase